MELMAAISALDGALAQAHGHHGGDDSAYVKNGVTGWMHGVESGTAGARRMASGEDVELWQRLEEAAARHKVECAGSRAMRAMPE